MPTRCPERLAPLLLALAAAMSGCRCGPEAGPGAGDGDLADAGDAAAAAPLEPSIFFEPPPPPPPPPEPRCPPEMVRVDARFCIDRYEATLVDAETGSQLSPYYPPSRRLATSIEKTWQKLRLEMGGEEARAMALPPLPAFQRQREALPRAVSRKGVVPNGYVSGELAALACKNAGKRLCAIEEWRTACMGEKRQKFPYGDEYKGGRCNVFREAHPAQLLHDDMTIGHSDPRLNLVQHQGRPLLRRTGETATCLSAWEDDAIADMAGNLDEWVDDPEGTFAGGFYSRSTREGCMSAVSAHTFEYFDYSTGVRCCRDVLIEPAAAATGSSLPPPAASDPGAGAPPAGPAQPPGGR